MSSKEVKYKRSSLLANHFHLHSVGVRLYTPAVLLIPMEYIGLRSSKVSQIFVPEQDAAHTNIKNSHLKSRSPETEIRDLSGMRTPFPSGAPVAANEVNALRGDGLKGIGNHRITVVHHCSSGYYYYLVALMDWMPNSANHLSYFYSYRICSQRQNFRGLMVKESYIASIYLLPPTSSKDQA